MRIDQWVATVTFFCMTGNAVAENWHSVAAHGMVVEDNAPSSRESFLPTSQGEVILWSNEASVMRELERENAIVYRSDAAFQSSDITAANSFFAEQRYSSRRPVLYMNSPNSKSWSTASPNPHQHVDRILYSRPTMSSGTWIDNRPTGLIPLLMDFEYRKNLWLRRTFWKQ